jgi:hypothetical protein
MQTFPKARQVCFVLSIEALFVSEDVLTASLMNSAGLLILSNPLFFIFGDEIQQRISTGVSPLYSWLCLQLITKLAAAVIAQSLSPSIRIIGQRRRRTASG